MTIDPLDSMADLALDMVISLNSFHLYLSHQKKKKNDFASKVPATCFEIVFFATKIFLEPFLYFEFHCELRFH